MLGLILLITSFLGVWQAKTKPFWFDEILTIEVSSLPSPELRWQALYAGCDGMPPGYYWINAMAARLPFDDHIRWRGPELLGWLLALTGVYHFTAAVCGRSAGLAAVLLLALTPVSSYAWEARPYALLLGVLAWAAASWQRAERHWGWIAALAALLATATNLHYLAPLSVVCFALAETAVSLAERRLRWRIWAAFAAAAIPTLLALPLLIKMKADFGARFWARPELGGLPYYYGNLLGFPLAVVLVLLPFGLPYLLRSILKENPASPRRHALFLTMCLLLLPVLSLLFTLATHGGFNERYTMPMVIGYAAAIPLLLAWRPGGLARGFTLSLLLAFLVLSGREASRLAAEPPAQLAGESGTALTALRSAPEGLLLINNPLDFLAGWYYANPAQRARLAYIGDTEAAYRLGRTDGAVRLLLALRQFYPVPVRTFEEFLPDHREFTMFSSGPPHLQWQPSRLKELGWKIELFASPVPGRLDRVRAPQPGS
ncbi:glycosyltransferase family 39 protein [Paludibaculum fermentans]|uniref:Glycosyltransferase family 39 protein n=1 Tax=Paludibaculum fermentans TaxID=1473598 RepID=A0A7S7NWN5_PALFE|nr:glycosyltransferase family 39 protein [Paludibaculum fermentans]QOY91121.1 glycosyltransferase family 39 protein [Paludibaculum fermentans]